MKKELLISFVITFLFLSLGVGLLHYDKIGYGISFFVFLPFVLGYVLGSSTVRKFSIFGFLVSLFFFLLLLLIGKLEGMICVMMSLPIILIPFAIGFLIRAIFINRRKFQDQENQHLINSSIMPFLCFLLFGFAEKFYTKDQAFVEKVETERVYPYSTMQVYDAIKSVDTLIASKTPLMKLDLPIPYKCVLEKEEIGALRTCYFSSGEIVEKITELEKGKLLKMDIIEQRLVGRKWLQFKEAIYTFEPIGIDSCKLVRITTYQSVLKPRFYWFPLEKMGIEQEHDFVLENLKNDLKKNSNLN